MNSRKNAFSRDVGKGNDRNYHFLEIKESGYWGIERRKIGVKLNMKTERDRRMGGGEGGYGNGEIFDVFLYSWILLDISTFSTTD